MIVCKSPADIERMRAANQLVARILEELSQMVAPGVSTAELDAAAESTVRAAGAEPAFKGYRGYPATLCASVNEQVVHGIPERPLKTGDIVSLDIGVNLDGFYGDAAVTVPVGRVARGRAVLLKVTEEALEKAIAQLRVGGRISDIGHAVQRHAEAHGFSVVREFVGHGIGAALHEEPQIAELRGARARAAAGPGHDAGHRADGEHGRAGGEGARGRLDGGDPGRQSVRPLRAHGRRHQGWAAGAVGAAGPRVSGSGAEGREPGRQVVTVEGVVKESLPNALYQVELDAAAAGDGAWAGRAGKNFIRVLVGDRVRLELDLQGS